MADQKLLFELRELNPGVSDKDLIGAVAEATNSDPSKVQQALSPSILQKDREVSAIDRLRLANPGVADEDLLDNVAIETNRPVSQVRKALGMSDTKLNEFQSKSFGERALGVPGDLLGLNSRGASVFDSNKPGSTPEEDLSFPEQQARKERQRGTTSAAARILKNAKPKSFEEMSRSEREAFKAEQNKPGFFDTVSEVGTDIFTPEGFSKVEKSARKFPRAIGSLFTDSLYVSGDEADYLSARGEGRNFGDVAKSLAAGSNDLITSVLSNYENFLGGRELLATFGLTDPSSMPSQMFKREADALAGSMSEVAKLDMKPRFNDDGSLVNIDDRGSIAGVAFNFLRSAPIMLTTAAVGMPLAAASLKGFPAAVEKISPLVKSFISKHFPTLATFLAEGLPFASISAVIESGLAGADTVEKIMKAPERELLGNREYLQARIDGVDEATARKALAQAASIDASYQNAAAAFAGGIIAGGGIESMLARFAAGKVTMSSVMPKLDGSKTVGELAKAATESRGKFIAKEAAQGALSEGVEEGYVSGQQKLIENDIERRYLGNRSIDPNEGLWGATAEGGLVGMMSGTALGGAFAAAKPKTDELTRDLDEYKNAKSVKEVIDIARSRLANSTTKENVDKFLNDRFEEQVLTQLESPELQEAAGKGEDITGKIWDSLGGENNMFGYTHDEFQQKLTDIAAQDPEAAVTDQPVTDQPVTDQPVTDQPVTDQPVTDQPVDEVGDDPISQFGRYTKAKREAYANGATDEEATAAGMEAAKWQGRTAPNVEPMDGQPVDEAATADAFNARMDEATAEKGPTVTTADGTPVTAFDPPPTPDVVDATTVTPDTLPFATRENVTPAQVEARKGIATSLLENLTKRVGGRLLATNISRELLIQGSSALVGKKVESAQDLAVISQVLRDPRMETLRFFFVKDGSIVDHRTYSSRMPGAVTFNFGSDRYGAKQASSEFIAGIKSAMAASGADGYYVMHNHPQGIPDPSPADIDITKWYGENIPGLIDHVVINSNKFARIYMKDGEPLVEMTFMDLGARKLPPAGNHPILGASILTEQGEIDFGKVLDAAVSLKHPDDVLIAYGVNGEGEIGTIVELPSAFLNLPVSKQVAYMRAFSTKSGASNIILSAPTKLYGRIQKFLGDGVQFVMNHEDGTAMSDISRDPDELFTKGKPIRRFEERSEKQIAEEKENRRIDAEIKRLREQKKREVDEIMDDIYKDDESSEPGRAKTRQEAKAEPQSVEQVTDLERAIAKLAAKATTEGEKKKGIKRVNTADMAKIFPHKDGSLAKLKNVDVLVDDKPPTGAAAVWDGDNIVLNTNGKNKDEISQILEDISKKILTERKEALARLRKTEIPTGAKAADLTPEQQAKNQIAKSKALVDFYLKVKPLADLQNVAPSMQHLIPLSKRIQASKVKVMPDLTKTEQKRMDYQDYMLAWKMLQGSNIVDFELDATTNVYQQENLGKALAANDIEDFHKQVQDGVIKYMKDNDIDPKDVADYLFYLHVPEANAQIQKLWNDPRALAAGVDDKAAEAAMKKLEAKAGNKMGAIREAGKQWQDIAKETGQMLVDSGRISKEKHAAMTAVYKNYVPLRGNQDDSRVDVRRKGHEKREDEFILENIVQMREAAIIAIERNRLNGILANFIAKVRNDNIGTISRPTKVATIKNQTVYEVRSSGKNGEVLGIFEDRDDAALFMDKYDLITKGNAIIKPTKEERAVMMAKPKLAPNEVVYYDNGEAIRIQINNDSLKRGIIDGAEKVVEGLLIKLSAKSLRLLTKVYTSWNLEFSAVNMIRDLTGSPLFILGEKGFFETLRVLGNYPRAITTLLVKPNDNVVQQFRKYGGNIGAAYLTDLERVQSDLKSEIRGGVMYAPKKGLGALGKALNHLNGASENALRLAVMMEGIRKANALRESGGSDLQIETMLYDYAQLAKDLMNFNRKGLSSNNMNATFIFFNAGMQGNQVVAHAIMRSKHKKQVWSAISGAMIISMFASLAAMGAFEDDEEERIKKMMEYKSLDAYSKHRNLIVGNIKIPLAYGFSVFHSIGTAMAEMAMGLPMDKTAIELAESAWLNFVPISAPITTGSGGVEITPAQSLPTLLGIIIAPQVNQDTFGRAIVPKKYDQSVIDAKTMTNAMKDSPYEWAAMALNKASGGDENRPGAIDVSPNTLNFFARTFTGGTGSGMFNMGTVVYLYYNGAGSTVETSELPFARKFSVPKDDVRKSRSRFFDVKDTMQKEISRFKRDVKDEKVTELADQLFSPEEMKEANRISKAAKALKEEAREINNDKSLTVLQRRIQTKELELQELQLYNDFLIDFQRKYGNKF